MKKTLINIFIISLIFLLSFLTYLKTQNIIICFNKIEKIFINGSQIKKETSNLTENIYEAEMLNSEKTNIIKLFYSNKKNKIIKKKIKKLNKNHFLRIYSLNDNKLYKIRTLPNDFPEFTLEKERGYTEGYLFSSIMVPIYDFKSNKPITEQTSAFSFGFILDIKNDKIVFYVKSKNNITNLQKNFTKSKKVFYSYNVEPAQNFEVFCPLCNSFGVLLDDNFQRYKKIYRYPRGNLDPHFLYFIDDNHYIFSTIHSDEMYIRPFKKKMRSLINAIQEVKDDKLLFEHSLEEFNKNFEKYNLWNAKEKEYVDFTHINSLIVDPKDNNLIISCGTISTIAKLERNTGKILWRLGGNSDDFGLSPNEKPIMQHSLSLSNDGYLTLLNNNNYFWLNKEHYKNFHPGESEILQFNLDENNLKVIDFRKYLINESIYAQGSAYNITDNRFLIAHGIFKQETVISELDVKENKKYMQVKLPKGSQYDCYNAYIYKTLD